MGGAKTWYTDFVFYEHNSDESNESWDSTIRMIRESAATIFFQNEQQQPCFILKSGCCRFFIPSSAARPQAVRQVYWSR